MKTCLKDDVIVENGGYDLDQWDDENMKDMARGICEAIVFVSCVTDPSTPTVVCRMYMQAALDSGYHLIFVEKSDDSRILRFQIQAAKLDLE